MLFLGRIETPGGDDLGHDRLLETPGGFQLAPAGLGGRPLGIVANEDRRAVLRATVAELPVRDQWVDVAPKDIQQLFVADLAWIIKNFDGFRVTRAARGDLLVSWIGDVAADITGHHAPHAG